MGDTKYKQILAMEKERTDSEGGEGNGGRAHRGLLLYFQCFTPWGMYDWVCHVTFVLIKYFRIKNHEEKNKVTE